MRLVRAPTTVLRLSLLPQRGHAALVWTLFQDILDQVQG